MRTILKINKINYARNLKVNRLDPPQHTHPLGNNENKHRENLKKRRKEKKRKRPSSRAARTTYRTGDTVSSESNTRYSARMYDVNHCFHLSTFQTSTCRREREAILLF